MLFFRQKSRKQTPHRRRPNVTPRVETLEDRSLPSTFAVVNLNDGGAGSLRHAIMSANAQAGADVIEFGVSGTIQLTSGALPTVTDTVNIDGTTALGYAGTPGIEIDYNQFAGLRFGAGAAGSALRSLGHVNAIGNGVTLQRGGNMLIVGNYIGLEVDGTTSAGNGVNGLSLLESSNNTIGGTTAAERNLFSSNNKHGIYIRGGADNVIIGNFIGTDATGLLNRGNANNGITLLDGATGNTIGGTETGGNDPTNAVYVRPPQGNLISANHAHGVLITGKASFNTLNGNFIGTNLTGNAPLGNTRDGVAIDNANRNALVGCALGTDPFVYYNVISGNGGNGLRVTNSNHTTIQGNFFGLGANNQTPVGNMLNGVLVGGTSATTTMGGPIPLGNVTAANGENGILVQDTASFFVSYNTFCGLAAFQTYTNLGNGANGMKITATGGNILLRTNVITENANNGIEVSGNARGVRIAGNIIGLDTNGNAPMGNKNNGIEVKGNAHHVIIGGPQDTFNIIPQNAISANEANGVAITGNAHHIEVSFSFIGTNLAGSAPLGNFLAGVFVGPGAYANTLGSTDPNLFTVISGNLGDGVEMLDTRGNTMIGCLVGTDVLGTTAMPNAGDGVSITNSFNNVIGRNSTTTNGASGGPTNLIAHNIGDGVLVASGNRNVIRNNSIFSNTLLGIDLAPGANANQAAPVLTSVNRRPLGLEVSATLTSTPNTLFTIEFFANETNAPSGRYYLGTQTVTTNAAGVAEFTFFGPHAPTGSNFITATATSAADNTSEFSVPLAPVV